MPVEDEEEEAVESSSESDTDLRIYTHQDEPEPDLDPQLARQASSKTFVTASSFPMTSPTNDNGESSSPSKQAQASRSEVRSGSNSDGKRPDTTVSTMGGSASASGELPVDDVSTTSLLHKTNSPKAPVEAEASPAPVAKGILAKSKAKRRVDVGSSDSPPSPIERAGEAFSRRKSTLRNLVKFDIPEDSKRASIHFRAKQAQMSVQRASTKLRRRKIKDGLIVKMERMLVRVDTAGREVPDDFDENESQKIDSRVRDKWREYMVVCRHSESEDHDFVLQMYKTRVSMTFVSGRNVLMFL